MISKKQLRFKQRGSIMLLSMVMLIALTGMVIASAARSKMDQQVVRFMQDRQLAEQAAKSALWYATEWVKTNGGNNLLPATCTSNCDVYIQGKYPNIHAGTYTHAWWTNSNNTRGLPSGRTLHGPATQPRYVIEEITDADNEQAFLITARGTGKRDDTAVILQKIYKMQEGSDAVIHMQFNNVAKITHVSSGTEVSETDSPGDLSTVTIEHVKLGDFIYFQLTKGADPTEMIGYIEWDGNTYPTHAGYFTNVGGLQPNTVGGVDSQITTNAPEAVWISSIGTRSHATWSTTWEATSTLVNRVAPIDILNTSALPVPYDDGAGNVHNELNCYNNNAESDICGAGSSSGINSAMDITLTAVRQINKVRLYIYPDNPIKVGMFPLSVELWNATSLVDTIVLNDLDPTGVLDQFYHVDVPCNDSSADRIKITNTNNNKAVLFDEIEIYSRI